jgi:hypothetical protein
MNLQEALQSVHAVKGVSSIMAGVSTGDYSVLPKEPTLQSSIVEAKANIEKYQDMLNKCTSDWSYWSILGDLEYWESVHDILQSAELVGPDNLPDIPKPNTEGCVVMDAIGRVRDFGRDMLIQSRKVKTLTE